jgi:uncharacterized DUF497 family protein
VIFEWDAGKASANERKHGVTFEQAATVFTDPEALTFPDPDHSDEELREITIGQTSHGRPLFISHCERGGECESSARELRAGPSVSNMKKAPNRKRTNDLRPEYDLGELGTGVRGKYYERASAAGNLVLIEPDLAAFFPDAKSVNRALRLLADAAQATLESHSR